MLNIYDVAFLPKEITKSSMVLSEMFDRVPKTLLEVYYLCDFYRIVAYRRAIRESPKTSLQTYEVEFTLRKVAR